MSGLIVVGMTVAVAVATALLVWSTAQIGSAGLERYRQVYTERANVGLRELFLFIDPAKLFVANIALIGLLAPLAWLVSGSWVPAVGIAVVAGFAPRFVLRHLRRRRMEKMELQLPDALLMLAGGMKAGVSLPQAIQQLVIESRPPLSQEFDLLLREQRIGVALDDALENMRRRVPLQTLTLAVSSMRIASETGGQLAETLERTSQTLRSKLAMEGKIRALTAQGKLQAWVVGALPMVLMYVLTKMEPAAMHLMFTTRMGWGALTVIALLEFFGVILIRKIVAIDV